MNHLVVRQAIIGSRRSSIGLLARNARTLGNELGFSVLSTECLDNTLEPFADNREYFNTLLIEDLGQAEGFNTLSISCLYELVKKMEL